MASILVLVSLLETLMVPQPLTIPLVIFVMAAILASVLVLGQLVILATPGCLPVNMIVGKERVLMMSVMALLLAVFPTPTQVVLRLAPAIMLAPDQLVSLSKPTVKAKLSPSIGKGLLL